MTRTMGWLLLLCFLVAAAAEVYPLYVIRPFRHQGAGELMVALQVLRYGPGVMVLCSLLSLVALIRYWGQEKSVFRRSAAIFSVVIVAALAVLSRVNIYEIMFHPDDRPSFSTADAVKLDGDEKVIAVNVGGEARAYPIRNISYHHVINDVLGGVPIVATY